MRALQKNPRHARTATLTGLLWILSSQMAFADFQSAYKAYREGKFAEASTQFMDLAKLGDGASQFNLGAMSVRGEGIEKNIGAGVGWMLAAEENGYTQLTPDQLAKFKAGLTPQQSIEAGKIIAQYGKAALQVSALPGSIHSGSCTSFQSPRQEQIAVPSYPLSASENRQDGIVLIEATIGIDGLARDPHILIAFPAKTFDDATINALLRSRFIPATRNGEKVESQYTFHMTYYIEGGGQLWNINAVKRISAAADQGQPVGKFLLGLLGSLDRTLEIPRDEAKEMILNAAQAGHPSAQYWIASELNIDRLCGNPDKVKLWLRQAAKGGDANAQIELVRYQLATSPQTINTEEIKSLLNAATEADVAYTLKHAAAIFAAPPVNQLADNAAALRLAARLKKHDNSLDPHINEVMAAAYAVNGNFRDAVTQQERTITKARKLYWNTSNMEARLIAYKEKRAVVTDLLTVPPTVAPLPPIKNEIEDCTKKKKGCGRDAPDSLKTPTGSHIKQ